MEHVDALGDPTVEGLAFLDQDAEGARQALHVARLAASLKP